MKQMFSENEILKMISENVISEEQVDEIAQYEATFVCNNYGQITLKNSKLYVYSLGFNHAIIKASSEAVINKIMEDSQTQTQETAIYFYLIANNVYGAFIYDSANLDFVIYWLNPSTHQFTFSLSFHIN